MGEIQEKLTELSEKMTANVLRIALDPETHRVDEVKVDSLENAGTDEELVKKYFSEDSYIIY